MKKTVVIILTVAVLGLIGYGAAKTKPGLQMQTPMAAGRPSGSMVSSSSSSSPSSQSPATSMPGTTYADGNYNGTTIDSAYGPVQIEAIVSGGRITDIKFLQMPSDLGHSREVTQIAGPMLKSATLSAQSANIDFVSGATSTSGAYQQSLQSALDQAAKS